MSRDLDVVARLQRLGRLLDEYRVPVTAGVDRETDAEATGIVLNAFLDRIQRLADEVRSGLECRRSADTLDAVTARLLLEDYAAAVRELRTLANQTGQRLSTVASTIDKGNGFIQRDHERQR